MNQLHPKSSRAATCALVAALLAAGGCKSTSSGVNNPFLAPDRVAPPSTRALAPGQAQPYYPGDPLPVMQSATAPPPNNLLTSNSAAEARSSTGKTLAWSGPSGTTPAAPSPQVAAGAASPWDATPKAAASVTHAKEPAVVVPTDSNELRFALPAPVNPEPAAPIAAAVPASPQPSQAGAAAQPPQPQGVMLASYNAPAANGLSPVTTPPTLVPTPQITSPWRTPQTGQVTQPPTPPMYGMQASPYQAVVVQPVAPAAAYPNSNPVAVQLRSVPAPPPRPGDPMPRIRFPGYEVPQTAAADGFRPRSTMR